MFNTAFNKTVYGIIVNAAIAVAAEFWPDLMNEEMQAALHTVATGVVVYVVPNKAKA